MRARTGVIVGLMAFLLGGCSPRFWNLVSLNSSRNSMDAEVRHKTQAYAKLKNDIMKGRLKEGRSRNWIIDAYGDPVLEKDNFFLYRHPTEYFSSDLIYLYFDQNAVLTSWEIKPAK